MSDQSYRMAGYLARGLMIIPILVYVFLVKFLFMTSLIQSSGEWSFSVSSPELLFTNLMLKGLPNWMEDS